MNIIVLPDSKEMLDVAFRKARKQAARLKSERNNIKDAKGKNIRKIEVASSSVSRRIGKAVESFPSLKEVHPFYLELIKATVDVEKTLKAMGHMSAERSIMAKIKGNAIGRIKGLGKTEARKAAVITAEYYGRLSDLTKKLDSSIKIYNTAAKKMKELPKIKFDIPSIIIAGFPNTGKSTILGRLTKSQPKVASYPFTTQKLQIGYMEHKYSKVQIVDTPGLLDRPIGERNRIERKAIAALKHLSNAIIFVVDPTARCGFPIEQQASLLKEIKAEFEEDTKILVVINKADIATEQELALAQKIFGNVLVDGENLKTGLEEEVRALI